MVNTWNPAIIGEELEKVKAASSAGIEANAEAIEALGAYSTTEVDTGMKYGNDNIYRKIFVIEHLPNNTTAVIQHGISGISSIIDLRCVMQNSEAYSARLLSGVYCSATEIRVVTSSDLSSNSGLVIIEYTKATTP